MILRSREYGKRNFPRPPSCFSVLLNECLSVPKFCDGQALAYLTLNVFSYFQYSLCSEPLIELSNSGASGSLFYVSSDDEFIIKTVQHKEAEFLQKLLPGYYMVSGSTGRGHSQQHHCLCLILLRDKSQDRLFSLECFCFFEIVSFMLAMIIQLLLPKY